MKLRLTQAGFETYSAQMGVIFFENGLSTTDVLVMDATRMAAVMQCEWEDGTPANVSQIYLDNLNTPAPVFAEAGAPREHATEPESVAVVTTPERTYTEDELAAIADAEGIAGLRVIADQLDIKGNSIRGLIEGILKVASTPKAQ